MKKRSILLFSLAASIFALSLHTTIPLVYADEGEESSILNQHFRFGFPKKMFGPDESQETDNAPDMTVAFSDGGPFNIPYGTTTSVGFDASLSGDPGDIDWSLSNPSEVSFFSNFNENNGTLTVSNPAPGTYTADITVTPDGAPSQTNTFGSVSV